MILCFIAYTGAYISRTNLSPALDALQKSFGTTAAKIGLLPTLFAIPYAAGQIVTGLVAERKRPVRIMTIGLVGSGLINILFSFSASYTALLILWFINGCFQSMIWTPVLCIMTQEFREESRGSALFFVTVSLIAGYLIAWLLSGFFTSRYSWRTAFKVTGSITLLIAVFCFFAMEKLVSKRTSASVKVKKEKNDNYSIWKLFVATDLMLILLFGVVNGYLKDGIMNWAPKLLMETQGIDLSAALGVLLVIPVINFFGIQGGRVLYVKLKGNSKRACFVLMILSVILTLLLTFFHLASPLFCTILLAFCSACAYGVNPLLTSFIPLLYEHTGHLPFVAGLIDAAIYIGSALSGFAAGGILDRFGWTAVFISWMVFSLAGAAFLIAAGSFRKHENGLSKRGS